MMFQQHIKKNSKDIKTRQKEWSKLSLTKRHTINPRKRRVIFLQVIKSILLFVFSLVLLLGIYILKSKNYSTYINPLAKIYSFSSSIEDTTTKEKQLKNLLEHSSLSIETIDIASDSAIIVKNYNGETYTFSQTKDLVQQTSSLQHIKTQLTIEGKRLKTADFRFNDPVVTLF